jgi:hypothetical protein
MKPALSRAAVCLSLAFTLACGEEDKAQMKQIGSDLKDAGAQAGSELKEAGSQLSAELAQAGGKLDAWAKDVATGVTMKGDELATKMKTHLPDLEKMVDDLEAKGSEAGASLSAKLDQLKADVEALAQAGAAAGADIKQKVLDSFAALASEIKTALAKLG